MKAHRALFLDRDGVINVERGYVARADEFEFMDGIFDLCQSAKRRGYLIIVVTNQAGIGRGYYTEQAYQLLTAWMCEQFLQKQIEIARVYFCPYHGEHGIGRYRQESWFRKPAPGMILTAADDFGIDLARSILVGDKESDIQAGISAGVGMNILLSSVEPSSCRYKPTHWVRHLSQVSRFLS